METNITYPESESTIKIENLKSFYSSFQTVSNLNKTTKNGFIYFTIDENQMNLFFEQFQQIVQTRNFNTRVFPLFQQIQHILADFRI